MCKISWRQSYQNARKKLALLLLERPSYKKEMYGNLTRNFKKLHKGFERISEQIFEKILGGYTL